MKKHYLSILIAGLMLTSASSNAFVGSTRDLAIIAEFGVEENINLTLSMPDEQQPAGLGAASNLLLNILFQEIPIFAPKTLWDNIARHKKIFDDFAKLNKVQLTQKYGKHPRFRTTGAITEFQQQTQYLYKLYERAMHHINTTNTLAECKKAMATDPLFKTSAAPSTLHQGNYDKWLELSAYLMCSVVQVNRYDIHLIKSPRNKNAIFYLFLPHTYLRRIEEDVLQHPTKYTQQKKLTASELALGLKISAFPIVDNPFTHSGKIPIPDDYPDQLLPALKSLFITKKEIPAKAQQKWTFYIMGHGIFSQEAKDLIKKKQCDLTMLTEELDKTRDESKRKILTTKIRSCHNLMVDLRQGNKVIGLPIDTFVKLLTFLDTDLNTNLLFYSSCSAGGKQWLDSFSKNGKPLRLSYAILADTLSEAPSLNGSPVLRLECIQGHKSFCSLDNLIDWSKRSLAIDAVYDFQSFFAMGRCPKAHPTLISHMIHSLCPAYPKKECDTTCVSRWVGNWFKRSSHIIETSDSVNKKLKRSEVNNITSIRLPGDTTFKVVDAKNSFTALTSGKSHNINAQTHDLILLGNPTYNTITITRPKKEQPPFPFMVSFIPGKASHTIEHLKAPTFSLLEIFDQFFSCEKIGAAKLIHIKKLECINDLNGSSVNPSILTNVYVFMSTPFKAGERGIRKLNGIMFDQNNKHKIMSWSFMQCTPDRPQFKTIDDTKYASIVESLKQTFSDANTLAAYSQHNNALITLDEITDFYLDE